MTIKKKIAGAAVLLLLLTVITAYYRPRSSHQEMLDMLTELRHKYFSTENPFSPEVKWAYVDSQLKRPGNERNLMLLNARASLSLKVGKEEQAVQDYENGVNLMDFMNITGMMPDLGIAYMRLGERSNCMLNHNGSSCIFPIKDGGVHVLKTGSTKAIQTYETILRSQPDDYESKWLLNIAFMTLGRYPQDVPKEFLIPGLNSDGGTRVKPFTDVAADLGLNINGRAGGVIVDDFNNDGYLDIVTSAWDLSDPMHYFQNNKDGSFTDLTEQSGLKGLTGGLNIQQTDYNNDGNLDIFVLRGAWNTNGYGNQPSSLLRNNGDGTFTDVTTSAGLFFMHPTQAAVWADFNNDGWLDVFIGAENPTTPDAGGYHHCMLYMNNQDGTFTEVAQKAHCDILAYVKGATSADFDHDGYPDVFLSTMNGQKYLFRNKGIKGGGVDFEDVTEKAGIASNKARTFTTWFYDYDNDGWSDILIADYNFQGKSLAWFAGAEGVGKPVRDAGTIYLYHNNHNGTFTNVSKQTGLDKVTFSMGANFGDIDNDGYPDMYFGTGNPDFKSLVPNKMFKNLGGKKFADVTVSSRTGNLQKGHGVAFADIRNTGVQDIFAVIGGAYKGDSYTSSLFMNPGQSNNNWISLKLEGVKANKAAIGSHIKLTFTENGVKRSVYKDVNSGGSFGSSPLRQEIGIGQAKSIDEVEITWAGDNVVQRFQNVAPNQFLHITEGQGNPELLHLKTLTYKKLAKAPTCMPMMSSLK
ncbi:MAG: CRTAC1 family protein [Bacteroidota bacterium]